MDDISHVISIVSKLFLFRQSGFFIILRVRECRVPRLGSTGALEQLGLPPPARARASDEHQLRPSGQTAARFATPTPRLECSERASRIRPRVSQSGFPKQVAALAATHAALEAARAAPVHRCAAKCKVDTVKGTQGCHAKEESESWLNSHTAWCRGSCVPNGEASSCEPPRCESACFVTGVGEKDGTVGSPRPRGV